MSRSTSTEPVPARARARARARNGSVLRAPAQLIPKPTSEQRLQAAPHVVGDDALTSQIGMHAIGLIQLGATGDSIQQERKQRHFLLMGDLDIGVVKRAAVLAPVV